MGRRQLREVIVVVAVHIVGYRGRDGLDVNHLFWGVDVAQRASLDEAQRVDVALAEMAGGVPELPAGGILERVVRWVVGVVVALEGVVNLVEAVHVELADERGDVGVLEVKRQHLGELFAGEEVEGLVGRSPPYQMGQVGVSEHVVELVDEHGLGLAHSVAGYDAAAFSWGGNWR